MGVGSLYLVLAGQSPGEGTAEADPEDSCASSIGKGRLADSGKTFEKEEGGAPTHLVEVAGLGTLAQPLGRGLDKQGYATGVVPDGVGL